jgi:pentatricopeptide repeat protein
MKSERELPLIQKGVVDSCFEEGQYEYGIDVLDKLRTQGYKPSRYVIYSTHSLAHSPSYRLHIRQLLYISLYPPPPSKRMDRADVLLSPQKGQFQRQKQDLWPKPSSRPLAIALLNAFIRTNSPECLMRGLPYHSYIDNDGAKDVDPFGQEETSTESEDNSPLKDVLLEMQHLKDCWGLLRDGFVKRQQLDRFHLGENESLQPENAIVGPFAWPVLEWLIRVYETDERQERGNGHGEIASHLCFT